MVSPLLSRELGTSVFRNPVAEGTGLALEFAGFVVWMHPVEDIVFFVLER